MGASKEEVVTTRGVVARKPRPLAALVLRLAVAGRPQALAALGLGFAVARRPRVDVLIGAALMLGVAAAASLVSCSLFACPFAARPPPSPATLFRTC